MNPLGAGPGMMAFANGDFAVAAEMFTETLEEDGANIAAFLMLSKSYNHLEKHDYAVGVILHGIQAYIELLENRPEAAAEYDMDELDECLAESIIACARSLAANGYREEPPEQLTTGLEYYLANFKLHLNTVVGVEAGLNHKSPILPEFESRVKE